MKPSTFISTFLLFVSILAAPVAQAPTPTGTTTAAASPTGDSAISDYLIVMDDNEKRPWSEIFAEMGAKWPTIKAFEGNQTHPFGDNLRAFTVEVTQAQADNIATMPNVVSVEKNSAVRMIGPLFIHILEIWDC
ncbi:hypothetical protein TWF191_003309 [Orbilia oligospora]|uniref:Inhibitor I9 domain-containing protein n=2 Tax=Orbilia oligospora TaxID=2813651 RepID=A0A7C8V197_ORBOL|nr:hypothetical protein TWF191_003309 [Orbilia oligospora]